ncbi:uncharacterized protein C8orf76 homolog isoform X2 [Sphaeramia orbicularis]|uniref:Uncharacterized protein n=1 Tax=Sphaeramia orbicularis TaxID=375764 RepID=A0A673A2E3_9TELE|nr:uncharacterized protein C8orf76-like isoform X2 [Sphaeramia orbicularis]
MSCYRCLGPVLMEIFGSTFDDSVFAESRARVSASLPGYSPKVCESEWFCDGSALDTDDSLEKQRVLKFRGDLAMRRGNYQNALEAYSCCLQWISDNNLTIRRDVLEGMARCCTKLGQRNRALDLAQLLSKDASNTCHLTSLLLLKVSIHRHFGSLPSVIQSMQQLCSLVPFNPWHWFSLGQTCVQVLDGDGAPGVMSSNVQSPDAVGNRNIESQSPCSADPDELLVLLGPSSPLDQDQDRVWLKACMCFIRSRLLLKILQQQQSSFVLRRSEDVLREVDEALRRLNPRDTTLRTLTEVMSEDLVPEKMREDYQDGDSLSTVSIQSFRERWWDKILESGTLENDGPQQNRTTQS